MSIVDVDGSRVVDLSKVGAGHEVDWCPDGRSILFASSRDHSDKLQRHLRHAPRRVGRAPPHNDPGGKAWSPDGSHIVFSLGGLFVMRADGSCIEALPVGIGETTFPDWR